MDFVNELKAMPIAVLTEKANEQHYEVLFAPSAFSFHHFTTCS